MLTTMDVIELDLAGPSKSKRIRSLELLRSDLRVQSHVVHSLLEIEQVPATITEYREKERHLEGLLKVICEPEVIDSEFSHICSFQYLLGSLYINFEKFWGPTVRVIIEFLRLTNFQQVLLKRLLTHLKRTNEYLYDDSKRQDASADGSRPDHILHRNLVFQILSHFVSFVETNSETFMEEFLLFVDKEIRVHPFIDVLSCVDLTSSTDRFEQKIDVESNGVTETSIKHVPDTEEVNRRQEKSRPASKNLGKVRKGFKIEKRKKEISGSLIEKRKSRETFITATKIIQSFSQIRKVHREIDMRQRIMELLSCRDLSIQRAAFNCLCAYNIEAIVPYEDTIRKMFNMNQIRSELTVFSINAEESNRILPGHREELIPIVQRIIYGRMISQIGKKSSGKDKATKRKDFVMRFIAVCSESEIRNFFRLLFNPLVKYIEEPYHDLEESLVACLDIKNFVPLSKLQAMLETIESFMKFVGHLKDSLLPDCLKLINIIGCLTTLALENEELVSKVAPKKLELLKNVRRSCASTMTLFFRTFEYYSFSQEELDFTFKFLVWPSSRSFVDRNHANITPLLRLIAVFCHSPVYHNLLIKRNKVNRDEYLLDHVMSLYSNRKTERTVIKYIGAMIADIVHPDRNTPDSMVEIQQKEPIQLIDQDSEMPPYSDFFKLPDSGLPKNHKVMLRYIPAIFERMSNTCEIFIAKKDMEYRFENAELLVLSRLSVYLQDSQHCILAAQLLLSTLDHLKKHELIIDTLKAAQNLMKQAGGSCDSAIISRIAATLYYQHDVEQRKELCNLLEILSEADTNLKVVYNAIANMNCLSDNLIGTPDLAKWNEGFRIAFDYFEQLDKQIDDPVAVKDQINLLMHQVGYIVNSVDKYEFSIRDNCFTFFERFSAKMKSVDSVKHKEFLTELLDEVILDKFIKKGLRNTNDMVKHMYLGIVRILSVNCSNHSKVFSEFHMFCHTNQDLDFWTNIRHIQLHNRSKALARLANDENLSKVSPKTLSSYFMPLASGFLFNKNYKSLASLTENAIKIIGLICRRLNWNTYEKTLNYYLNLLTTANATYQRTNIKLITEIIKNFNFDISACDEAMEHKAEDERLQKGMRKRLGPLGHESVTEPLSLGDRKRLNPSTARAVYFSVTKKLVPRLNNCLHEMTRVELEHDKNMADYMPEKDEIKRIPVAFAIVQLLNLLPCKYILLRDNLPPLFLKLVSFLKSKNLQTRKAARATLIRIMKFVGPAYISDLLRIMRQNLDKGFYLHVLSYTINSVLDSSSLEYGDLDNSSRDLIEICLQEIFGRPSEDKEVARVIAKTPEAKKTKGYDTLLILASNISSQELNVIIQPLKDYLKTANDLKMVNKLSVCLQRLFTGLSQNHQFPLDVLLQFVHSTIEESIPSLKTQQKIESADKPMEKRREDRYLINCDKTRDRLRSKINERGNLHMLVENSLKLLLSTFERNKMTLKSDSALQLQLDGFIKLLSTCLKSSSPRCVMRALKCLYFVAKTKIDLPTFKNKCNTIVKKIFILLSLYNGVGMAKGDNHEMIATCFRTLTLLLLKCEQVELSSDQLRALLSYIEQDLNDPSRQSTALKTLHSLVLNKHQSLELPAILDKVAETLVMSSNDKLRSYCIKVWQTYLLEYNHDAAHLQAYLSRFLRQLDYEYADGRRSVIQMLRAIIEKFPERILRDYHELFFYLLAQRVVNDDAQDIVDSVSQLISCLAKRLPEKQTFTLNKFILPWSDCNNSGLNLLGIKLLGIFIETCPDQFKDNKERMGRVFSILVKCLIKENDEKSSTISTDDEVCSQISTQDLLSYHSLCLFKRILDKNIVSAAEIKYLDYLREIWQIISRSKLNHRYEPVVLTACKLYLHILTKTNLAQALKLEDDDRKDYIERNATKIVVSLSDKYIDLLDRFDEGSEIHKYVVQSLIFIGQMVAHSKSTLEFEEKYLSAFENKDVANHLLMAENIHMDGYVQENLPYSIKEAKKRGDLMWLSTKIVMQARKEAALFRLAKSYRRDFVLRWTAAVAQELGAQRIMPYAFQFMTTPARELTDKGKNKVSKNSSNIITMSEDLLKFIKGLIGLELFNKIYSKAQLHFTKKRLERKQNEAMLRVQDQKKGVKRKLSQRREKDLKRRRNQATKRSKHSEQDIRKKK